MAAYDTAGNIISRAAASLGLGTVADAYGSTDATVVQLRELLHSAGEELVLDFDWTHLVKEYSIVTRPNWKTATAYTIAGTAWMPTNAYAVGAVVASGGNLYACTTAGTSGDSNTTNGPTAVATGIKDGSVVWKYLNSGTVSQVVSGQSYYLATTSASSGNLTPTRSTTGLESDQGTSPNPFGVIWSWQGNAADYALPSDFSNLIDQTGWNRTNRLPVGGPLDGQMWQYMAGRQQGVVFNVFFRPIAGLMRLYPYIDTPGGYEIRFEYVSSSWVSATGGTVPTTDAPTANSDIIYFTPLLMIRKLKLDWLRAKGFDTTAAERQYDDMLEASMNSDISAGVLNLRGRGPFDPLIGIQNIPPTGFGA